MIFQCYYSDILAYCEDTDVSVNADGECSVEFWDTINCMLTQCFGISIETVYPTAAPTGQTNQPTAAPIITYHPTMDPTLGMQTTAMPTVINPGGISNANIAFGYQTVVYISAIAIVLILK